MNTVSALDEDRTIKLMQAAEPVFLEAAALACEMQDKATASRKNEGGYVEIEIVTTADLACQEVILQALAGTELVSCRLLAEEDTPGAGLFASDSSLYITVDPIDGTANYAAGNANFSTMVGLHSATELLYTFVHFPRFDWTHRMVRDTYEVTGKASAVELPEAANRAVIYSHGDLLVEEDDPAAIAMRERGLGIVQKKQLMPDSVVGSTILFLGGYVPGIYQGNPPVYDGLVGLHFALTQGYEIYSKGPAGALDFSEIRDRPIGKYHPGYFVALR